MSLQLGLIVLPSDTAELNKVLEALSKLDVQAATISTGKTVASAPAKRDEPKAVAEKLPAVTADDVKGTMTRVRDELGEEMIGEILTAFGATKLKDVAKDDWAALVAAAKQALDGANGSKDDDDGFGLDDEEDDGFGLDDGDEGEEVDAETVKLTVQAYAKKFGKEKATALLQKFGLNTVRGLASADASVLGKIQKAAAL